MEKQERSAPQVPPIRRRRARRPQAGGAPPLVLSELERAKVFAPDAAASPPHPSGPVRETCPKCQDRHLVLVLRQASVRLAHLFCEGCHCCFDARYPDGKCALTI